MNSRQIGKFRISAQAIRYNPQDAAMILRLMDAVPVHAEMLFAEDAIEYEAISPLFAEVPPGQRPPEYTLIISRNHRADIDYVGVVPA